jgi:hypothetical protein
VATIPAVPVGLLRAALLWVTLCVLVALLLTAGTTIARSVRGALEDRRREEATERLQPTLFERIGREDPDWSTWLAECSPTERRVLESEVDRLLRLFTGTDKQQLRALANRLELGRRAERPFDVASRVRRFEALTWLALLDHPIDVDRLRERCSDDPDERAAVARVFYEREVPEASTLGTELLLRTGRPLPLFGLDTLYKLNETDPTALLETGAIQWNGWTDAILAQVLETLQYCDPAGTDAPLEWVFSCLSHEAPTVRAAAVGALGTYAWRPDVESRIEVTWLVADSDPRVRRAAYRHLAEWGDPADVRTMVNAARAESDDRALLILASELTEGLRTADQDLSPRLRRCLDWVVAERARTG